MKQQEVFKKIGGIIREINEQYEYLETTGGPYNDLELELMVANSHFLSDHIEILRKLNTQIVNTPPPALPPAPVVIEEKPALPVELPAPVVEEKAPAPEPRYFEPVMAEEPEPEDEPIAYIDETPESNVIEFEIPKPAEDHTDHFPEAEEVEDTIPEPSPEPETIRHELTLEDIGEDWEEDEAGADEIEIPDPEMYKSESKIPEPVFTAPEPVEESEIIEEPKPEPIKEAEPQPEPVAEIPAPKPAPIAEPGHTKILVPEDQVITLNQRMSAQMSTSRMTDHLTAQPISDLKSAISLNDKLMYIKDLFNGYGLAYSEAIDRLNRMQTFAEAETFLKSNYATKNHWDDKPTTADKFYAVLQRRYTP